MNTPRDSGCTLTGALSVTTEIEGSVTIIHGPAGCAHHNFSLFHALCAGRDDPRLPRVLSTDLAETDIIFGGEDALDAAIRRAAAKNPSLICVLSTCVTGAIGDDVDAICRGYHGIPVISIPTAGFLGGGFHQGHIQALMSLSSLAKDDEKIPSVNLVGEKTLENERDEHFNEVRRLLAAAGIPICTRFVCRTTVGGISRLSRGSCNILRDPSMEEVGRFLEERFGTPFISSFPIGSRGTIRFLEEVGRLFFLDVSGAIADEEARQDRIFREFRSLAGKRITFCDPFGNRTDSEVCREIASAAGLIVHPEGYPVPVPEPFPVGTGGIRRLLYQWRRACRA
jgi:nitrogenase molybdenum-iron protein alpha/beta subunit